MSTSVGPIYAAEQIKIPPDLPDILKNYTKAVLKDQPDDILTFSVAYFQQLSKHKHGAKELSDKQLDSLYSQLSKIGQSNDGLVSRQEVNDICQGLKIKQGVVEEVVRMGKFEEKMDWLKFFGLTAAAGSGDLELTLEACQDVKGNDGKMPVKQILQVFQFLAAQDPDWTKDQVEKIVSSVNATLEENAEASVDVAKIVKGVN